MANLHLDIAAAREIGKVPIQVEESAGFVVNRILIPMINEAVAVYAEGAASAEDIDTAMKLGANHPIGPSPWGTWWVWMSAWRLWRCCTRKVATTSTASSPAAQNGARQLAGQKNPPGILFLLITGAAAGDHNTALRHTGARQAPSA